jgi:large subunit ribosomal protein L3
MKFILAKKIGMSQVFDQEGRVTPVTLVEAGPCLITQLKDKEKDGYLAVQLAFDQRKRVKKPQAGHFKKAQAVNNNVKDINFRWTKEFLVDDLKDYQLGSQIKADVFSAGDKIRVCGISKGKGFQGVVKRHGFKGGPASHGDKDRMRAPGSIGGGFPERVWKGRRMAGRMGNDRVTVKGLKIIKVDAANNLLAINGAIPGKPGTLLEIIG